MGKVVTTAIMIALIIGAGCTRSTNALNINTQSPPQPLPSTPTGAVEAGQLDPITQEQLNAQQSGQLPDGTNPEAPTVGGETAPQTGTDVASLDQQASASSKPVTHEQLAGAWNVGSDAVGCRVFLSFTQWSGGYRAGSRSCQSPELAAVSAWDVKGSTVVLVDSNGNQVASLVSTGTEKYAGQTVSGKPVSFTR